MKVSILIPYRRQLDEPYRTHNLHAVTTRWSWYVEQFVQQAWSMPYADYEIIIGTNDEEPFNRSAARNAAFSKSNGDVLVICDADTLFVEDDALTLAFDEVENWEGSAWVIPYSTYWNASRRWTDKYYKKCKAPPVMEIGEGWSYEHKLEGTICGMIVMRRSVYETVGGYDERFKGWGYEDDAFGYAVEALFGKPVRLSGYNVIHMWHPHGPELNFAQPHIDHNRALMWEYERAAKNGTMRALIEGRK